MSWQPLHQSNENDNDNNDTSIKYSRYSIPIDIPLVDTRKYELIKLENELQVLCIEDPEGDRAAVSLDVGVGHMSDPRDMPGLAHFCEHLSFMGTKSYPVTNSYKVFIKTHGGSTNASTSSQRTTYHFKIQAAHLEGALDRFARFFHEPLFDGACVKSEVENVDSENGKNQQMDSRRLFQLWKSTSDSSHPWNTFGCGNRTTLLKDDADGGEEESRRRVVDWWEKSYCASRMKAVIIGADPMDKLVEMAIRHFSPIKNKSLGPCILTTDAPWSTPQLLLAKTIKNKPHVEIQFPIPYQLPLYLSKPARYVSHLLGHEGPGSAFYYLHQKGWATALNAGVNNAGRGVDLFSIDVTLTKAGVREYTKVLAVLFQYISLLPTALKEPHHFVESQKMGEINFLYSSKEPSDSYAKALSQAMNKEYAREHVISKGVMEWTFDEGKVKEVIECFIPQKARVMLATKDWEGEDGEWEKEKWYGTEFKRKEFDAAGLPTLTPEEASALYLPEKNPFLPENLQVSKSEVEKPLTRPSIIKETPLSRLWFKKDDQFWLPRGSIMIRIDSPLLIDSLPRLLRTRLYVELVKDALNGPGYAASLAGISFSFSFGMHGLVVQVSGYNDKLASVLSMVLKKLNSLEFKEERFEVVMERLKRTYDNAYLIQSSEMADLRLGDCTVERLFTAPEKRKELEFVRMEDVQSHATKLFERIHLTVMIHGNVEQEQAIIWLDQIEELLPSKALLPSEYMTPRSLLLPTGCNYILHHPVPNTNETNSSVSYLCRVGAISNPLLRAKAYLLSSILNEPFFNIMRTKEKLGYSVSCVTWSESIAVTIGIKFRIQSFRHPDYLEARIDSFIESYLHTLKSMELEEFEQHKRGAIAKKREKLMNLGEERARFWAHVVNGYLEFERVERDAEEIEKIDLDSLVQFYQEYIHPSSPSRSKLSVRLTSQAIKPEGQGERSAVQQGVEYQEYSDTIQLRNKNMKSSATPMPI